MAKNKAIKNAKQVIRAQQEQESKKSKPATTAAVEEDAEMIERARMVREEILEQKAKVAKDEDEEATKEIPGVVLPQPTLKDFTSEEAVKKAKEAEDLEQQILDQERKCKELLEREMEKLNQHLAEEKAKAEQLRKDAAEAEEKAIQAAEAAAAAKEARAQAEARAATVASAVKDRAARPGFAYAYWDAEAKGWCYIHSVWLAESLTDGDVRKVPVWYIGNNIVPMEKADVKRYFVS